MCKFLPVGCLRYSIVCCNSCAGSVLTCITRLQTHSDPVSCFVIDFLPNCIMVRNVLCGFRQFSFVNVSAMDQQMVANNSELENNVYSAIIWLGTFCIRQ